MGQILNTVKVMESIKDFKARAFVWVRLKYIIEVYLFFILSRYCIAALAKALNSYLPTPYIISCSH